MATTQVNFQVLDVGQGSGNFIEIYDGTTLTNTVLIDLGTTSGSVQGAAAVAYIAAQLNKMTKDGEPAPNIDLLIMTHSDADHISLVSKLLDLYPPRPPDPPLLTIGQVRYGGDVKLFAKGRAKKNVLTRLKEYCKDIKPPAADEGGVNAGGKWVNFWEQADVKIYLLAANVPETGGTTVEGSKKRKRSSEPSAYSINTRSMVNIIEWDNYWYATAGDATATTLVECNKVLAAAPKPFRPTFMLTLPHHGSKNTIFNLRVATQAPSDEAVEVVRSFAQSISAKAVCASANKTKDHHPSLFVIDLFVQYTDKTFIFWKDPLLAGDRHLYTAWVDKTITADGVTPVYASPWKFASLETVQNFYTTLYSRPGEIPLANYVYPPTPATALTTALPVGTAGGVRWNFYMTKTEYGLTRHPDNALLDATPSAMRPAQPRPGSAIPVPATIPAPSIAAPSPVSIPQLIEPRPLSVAAPSLQRLRQIF
ncbi:MBL fold metallo-hydrolase [Dyella tabacisoli]|uniref:MBL fold metallo-hydrolase n=1 Tax=Dyella tabacisoli TaxID=2282381 RepID=A0A369UQU0_9GAMM|nr:MBL fold metallo-hydrolase [Dyella tabacisoli]RDD83006.1 MBL fold metallo-hydrolase [Dyella tabacisoli]